MQTMDKSGIEGLIERVEAGEIQSPDWFSGEIEERILGVIADYREHFEQQSPFDEDLSIGPQVAFILGVFFGTQIERGRQMNETFGLEG